MDFGILIIPLIAMAIWILQYIFKAPEDNKQQAKPRGGGGPRTAVNKPRRQVSDLDRFLEETRKKKQQEESRPVVVAEVVPDKPPADRGESVERERKAAAARAKPQPPPRPTRQERKQRPLQPVPELRRPMVGAPIRGTSAPIIAEVVPITVTPVPDPLRPQAAPTTTKNSSPPILVELVKMLHNPRGAAMAMILREIFDTPVSRRRGAV
jgi:hypothetical protein